MIDAYRTLRTESVHKLTRKKSRFIAILMPVESKQDVERHLEDVRKTYHDASHHCYAFRVVAAESVLEASHDDGEPSGSAGVPILQQLESRDLRNVLAVVVRYFGGVKLGVGGLVRAYSDAVSEALESASIVTRKLMVHGVIRFPPEVNSSVMSVIHRFSVTVEGLSYEEPARIDIAVPPSRVEAFREALRESTGARADLEEAT